ncbi:uncharacterized protein ARMOST_22255 [Armillaria ostoyae]|uniref:Uncharacterized protein n=1 Tax=Armillaria ostoyae TaxID=47428 RepID=A0A284SCC4_ARMOS|nr:uncharacterized protein ARMOST_22255 [Armillaria ostoyae]
MFLHRDDIAFRRARAESWEGPMLGLFGEPFGFAEDNHGPPFFFNDFPFTIALCPVKETNFAATRHIEFQRARHIRTQSSVHTHPRIVSSPRDLSSRPAVCSVVSGVHKIMHADCLVIKTWSQTQLSVEGDTGLDNGVLCLTRCGVCGTWTACCCLSKGQIGRTHNGKPRFLVGTISTGDYAWPSTDDTTVFFNLNTVDECARFEKVLEDVLPSIRKALRLYSAGDSEVDLVVYNMYVLGVEKSIAAVFSNRGRLWGVNVMYWAPVGTLTKGVQHPSLMANTTPYRVVGAMGTPDSIVVKHPFEVAMHFITQLYMFPLVFDERMTTIFFYVNCLGFPLYGEGLNIPRHRSM